MKTGVGAINQGLSRQVNELFEIHQTLLKRGRTTKLREKQEVEQEPSVNVLDIEALSFGFYFEKTQNCFTANSYTRQDFWA